MLDDWKRTSQTTDFSALIIRWRAKGDEETILSVEAEKEFPSASTIKTLLMAAVLEKIYACSTDGRLGKGLTETVAIGEGQRAPYSLTNHLDQIELTIGDLITHMMAHSDNTATNVLMDWVGKDSINRLAFELGMVNTKMERHMCDMDAIQQGLQNTTSIMDLARLMYHIAFPGRFDAQACKLMRHYMSLRLERDNLVRYLPESLTVCHKFGELDDLNVDAGLIFEGDTILFTGIAVKGVTNNGEGRDLVAKFGWDSYNEVLGK